MTNKKISKREEILDKAKEIVCGPREKDYGSPTDNLNLIAEYWNSYLKDLNRPLDGKDVALMQILVKVARLHKTSNHYDSILDIIGYGSLASEFLS